MTGGDERRRRCVPDRARRATPPMITSFDKASSEYQHVVWMLICVLLEQWSEGRVHHLLASFAI